MEFAAGRVKRDISARRLGTEPLTDISLRRAGRFSEVSGSLRATFWPMLYTGPTCRRCGLGPH